MASGDIKASYFAGNVAGLAALGPNDEARARQQLSRVIAGFDGLSRLDWVPLRFDLELTRVVHDIGGLRAVRAVNRRSFLQGVEGPLLRPIANAAIALLGLSPRTFLRLLARGWTASTRNLGVIEVKSDSPTAAQLTFRGLPQEALDDALWLEGFCGVEEAIYELIGVRGEAPSPARVGDLAVYQMTWELRK